MQLYQNLLVAALALLPAAIGAPLVSRTGEIIPGEYIVVLKEKVSAVAAAEFADNLQAGSRTIGSTATGLKYTYDFPSLKGYSGSFDDGIIEKIKAQDDVAYVELDRRIYTNDLVFSVTSNRHGEHY